MSKLKTTLNQIVDLNSIGTYKNELPFNELIKCAAIEDIQDATADKVKTMLLLIDPQLDFIEGGALGVDGSIKDTERTIQFIYNNLDKITNISVSLDTHTPFQIFHSCWWKDKEGNNPNPFTVITKKDIEDGKWSPVAFSKESKAYVEFLESNAKKVLVIWPYHCLQGTIGNAIESQLSSMIYFHSVVRKTAPNMLIKGTEPLSEMYGILKAENDANLDTNKGFINELKQYSRIFIAGQAKSHCVLESLKQILECFGEPSNIYLLDDCMSSIKGFEEATEMEIKKLTEKHNIKIVNSKMIL